MIIGSGMIARAFAASAGDTLDDVCLYAAGVSNSACQDPREFEREQQRLAEALARTDPAQLFVYFSTCSLLDPDAQASPYVRHKAAMEALVRQRPRHLIVRLPQLAGSSPNPHTLLNHLFARIARGERFQAWTRARRNIIDVDDVVRVIQDLIRTEHASGETVNVANARSVSIGEIIQAMEGVLGRRAIFDTMERGGSYAIDIARIAPALQRCGIGFPPTYLEDVIRKYYGHHAQHQP